MAKELLISASIDFAKGVVIASFAKGGIRLDVTGTKYVRLVQNIGTSVEALDLGDVGTPGYMLAYNHGSNKISIRAGSGGTDVVEIPPGGFALFKLATSTPHAIATTSAGDLEYLIVEA